MSTDTSLQSDALRLAELDRQAVRAVIEGNIDHLGAALGEYVTLRTTLKKCLLDESVAVVADKAAADVLRKINKSKGFPCDQIVERLYPNHAEHADLLEFDPTDIEELGRDLFFSCFSHADYIGGLAELRPLVLRASNPGPIPQLIWQLKNCYAFQQYDAAYALCRMVIESSVRDICIQRGVFPDLGDNIVLFEEHKWRELRDRVSSGPVRERLRRLYADLSVVTHARKTVTRNEAREAFEETMQVVELLYSENGL